MYIVLYDVVQFFDTLFRRKNGPFGRAFVGSRQKYVVGRCRKKKNRRAIVRSLFMF